MKQYIQLNAIYIMFHCLSLIYQICYVLFFQIRGNIQWECLFLMIPENIELNKTHPNIFAYYICEQIISGIVNGVSIIIHFQFALVRNTECFETISRTWSYAGLYIACINSSYNWITTDLNPLWSHSSLLKWIKHTLTNQMKCLWSIP